MNGLTSTQSQDLGFLVVVGGGTAVLAIIAFAEWLKCRFRKNR